MQFEFFPVTDAGITFTFSSIERAEELLASVFNNNDPLRLALRKSENEYYDPETMKIIILPEMQDPLSPPLPPFIKNETEWENWKWEHVR